VAARFHAAELRRQFPKHFNAKLRFGSSLANLPADQSALLWSRKLSLCVSLTLLIFGTDKSPFSRKNNSKADDAM